MAQDPLRLIKQAAKEGWQELDLRFTQLSDLAPEIGQLTHLKSLYIHSTPLSSLPSEIGQLTNLT